MRILPTILAFVTRKNRYLPELDFNWKGNVVHSLLMCYYFLFWRKVGVRHGGIAYHQDSRGNTAVGVKTLFGTLIFFEQFIIRRAINWKPIRIEIFQPQLAIPNGPIINSPFLFAVAWSASHGRASANSANPQLDSVSTTGSDRLLITSNMSEADGTTFSTPPTFGGSASTQVATYVDTNDGAQSFSTWRLVAPSTSSGSITSTTTNSTPWQIWADSYTGIDQTTPFVNATTGGNGGTITASPFDVVVASTRDGSLLFISNKTDSGAAPLASTTSDVQRQAGSTGTLTAAHWEANVTTDNGSSRTSTFTYAGGGQRAAWIAGMLQPVGAPVVTNTNFLIMFQ